MIEAGSLAATRDALDSATEAPLVVVVGGDGTVREAAAALADRQTPLAIVPGGTGNVLASTLGIRGIGPATDVIRAGRPRRLDLGMARWWPISPDPTTPPGGNERIFTVACGMGLDARIMAAAEHEWKRHLKFGAYIGAAVREVVRLESSRFRIVADGDLIEIEGYLVLVANAGELVPGRVGPRQPIDPVERAPRAHRRRRQRSLRRPARGGRADAQDRRARRRGDPTVRPGRHDRVRSGPADRDGR